MRLLPGGKIALVMGTGSHGQSLETTMAQVVADELGCHVDDITFVQGDTAFVPYGAGTGGSRSAVVAAGAARVAALQLRERVLEVAAAAMEAAPFDLEIEGGEGLRQGCPVARHHLRRSSPIWRCSAMPRCRRRRSRAWR